MNLIKIFIFQLSNGKPLTKSLPNQFENLALKKNEE
jgi:hypothetical protein